MIKQLQRIFSTVFVLLMAFSAGAAAHEIRPAIATATFDADGRYEIKFVANMEVLIAGIGPGFSDTNDAPEAETYTRLRALSAPELTAEIEKFAPRWLEGLALSFDGIRVKPRLDRLEVPPVGDIELPRLTTLYLTGQAPSGTPEFRWQYDPKYGSSVLRVRRATDGEMVAFWLKDGKQSEAIPVTGAAPRSFIATFAQYLTLGFTHIVPLGADHILFVLGLYLLSTRMKPLLVQVTSFTIAHSITLGLGLFGVITISPSIVEPLIAASIVFVAVENLLTDKLTPWRPYVVFGFGLIHGLGFAGVLHEIGLARADFVNGLIAFNLGVEGGQLTVILIAFGVVGLWFGRRNWYRARIVQPASIAIGLVGAFWFVDRVF